MDDGRYGLGVNQASAAALLFTQAIHAERARAFIMTGNLAAAAADAAMAAELDPTMPRAFLHRARACIGLKRYSSARAAVLAGAALAPGDPRFTELGKEIDELLVSPGQRRTSTPPPAGGAAGAGNDQPGKLIGNVHGGSRPVGAGHWRASSSVL